MLQDDVWGFEDKVIKPDDNFFERKERLGEFDFQNNQVKSIKFGGDICLVLTKSGRVFINDFEDGNNCKELTVEKPKDSHLLSGITQGIKDIY